MLHVCEYEVNWLTNEVIREKRNFNANCLRRRTPQSISRNFLRKNLAKKDITYVDISIHFFQIS